MYLSYKSSATNNRGSGPSSKSPDTSKQREVKPSEASKLRSKQKQIYRHCNAATWTKTCKDTIMVAAALMRSRVCYVFEGRPEVDCASRRRANFVEMARGEAQKWYGCMEKLGNKRSRSVGFPHTTSFVMLSAELAYAGAFAGALKT